MTLNGIWAGSKVKILQKAYSSSLSDQREQEANVFLENPISNRTGMMDPPFTCSLPIFFAGLFSLQPVAVILFSAFSSVLNVIKSVLNRQATAKKAEHVLRRVVQSVIWQPLVFLLRTSRRSKYDTFATRNNIYTYMSRTINNGKYKTAFLKFFFFVDKNQVWSLP